MTADVLVVGAGFAGSVMARQLAEAGRTVLVIDKRDHIGGNAFDYVNEHGIRVHKYGMHAFHTNSDAVFEFLSRFTQWAPYEHRVVASVEGRLLPVPINATTLAEIGARAPRSDIACPANAEEQCLASVGADLYHRFFEGYTQKQWGRHPRELAPSVTARIPFRPDSCDDRYFTDKHQALPKDGYAALFARMLDHANIEVRTSCAYRRYLCETRGTQTPRPKHTVWTGPIDEFFGYRLGKLPYRSLSFHHHSAPSRALRQPCAVVNYPSLVQPFTRTIEWRHLPNSGPSERTTITTEYPEGEGEPYYPIPAPENEALYKRYRDLADETDVTFVGRLATYKYLNMDQVVGQALAAARRLLAANPAWLTASP